MGTPASGKHIAVAGMGLLHIVDGNVTRFQETIDMMGLMQQIGAMLNA
jgi:predicted ester cyclase